MFRGFERQRISGWWKWKPWEEELSKEMQERRRRRVWFLKKVSTIKVVKKDFVWCTVEMNILLLYSLIKLF
jgi:hypothetical protein